MARHGLLLPAVLTVAAAVTLAGPPAASGTPDYDEGLLRLHEGAAAEPVAPAAAQPQRAAVASGRWRQAVDATWGPGLPTAQKLAIFDRFWTTVDEQFAAFQDLDVDWTALRDRYRPEIAAGVSRGRFAGIMSRLSLALRESHTVAFDLPVSFTLPTLGVPVLNVGLWGSNSSGACMTAQEDGSALVYAVRSDQALRWTPGDRILGFEGRPWGELYPALIDAELPLRATFWGSSPSTFKHSLVMSAGANWHLFDTVDVLRHQTGEVEHQATAPLLPLRFSPNCTEQLDIPGVPKPLNTGASPVSWGVVDGTNIGYVYVWGWSNEAGPAFAEAIRQVTQVRQTDGLIVDFRRNVGGSIRPSDDGLDLLFDHPVHTIGFGERADPDDHFKMRMASFSAPGFYTIGLDDRFAGEPPVADHASYDRPIAMLTGPGSLSAGDHAALRLALHPRVRTFGKSTATAFNGPATLDLGSSDWFSRYARGDAFRVGEPDEFLTHDEFPVDEPVWLTPNDAAVGRDTVVEAAVDWISQEAAP
jgi:hypothetical protein